MDHDCVSPTLSSFAVMNSEAAQRDGLDNIQRPFHNDERNKMILLQRPTARRRGAYDSSALALSAMAAAMEGFDDDDDDDHHHDGCDETGGGGSNRTLSRTRPKRPRVAFPEEQEEDDDDDDKDDELSPGEDGSGGGCVVQSVIELENAGGTMSFRAQRRRTNSWNASFGRSRRRSSCASGGNDVLPLMMSPPHGMPL